MISQIHRPSGVQRELGWVLDDAVAAIRASEDERWQAAEWRDVKNDPALRRTASDTSQVTVQLRASLQDLQVAPPVPALPHTHTQIDKRFGDHDVTGGSRGPLCC